MYYCNMSGFLYLPVQRNSYKYRSVILGHLLVHSAHVLCDSVLQRSLSGFPRMPGVSQIFWDSIYWDTSPSSVRSGDSCISVG